MKVYASVHKADKVRRRVHARYDHEDFSEPVWLKKHARELSSFRRTKFRPDDFVDKVNFDYLEIEIQFENP